MNAIDQIEEHAVYKKVEECQEKLKIALDDEENIEHIDEYATRVLNRADLILATLNHKINSQDPLLFSKGTLDSINNEINNLISRLTNYRNTLNNSSHINSFNQNLESIIIQMNNLSIYYPEGSPLETIRDSVTSFRRSLGMQNALLSKEQNELRSNSEELEQETKGFREQLEQLNAQVEKEFERLKEQYDEFQQSFLESREKQSTQFTEKISKINDEYQSVILTHKEEFQRNIESFSGEFLEKKQVFVLEQEEFIKERAEQNEEYNKMLNLHRESVEELVGLISTNSISGHYKEAADHHRTSLKWWQGTTLVSFILTISFGVYFFLFQESELHWTNLVEKAIVTSVLGSLTAYAARQATKNEIEEKKNRQMEVELKTLNPYIASFESEKQKELKEQLFPVVFGRKEDRANKENSGINRIDEKSLKQLTELINIIKGETK